MESPYEKMPGHEKKNFRIFSEEPWLPHVANQLLEPFPDATVFPSCGVIKGS